MAHAIVETEKSHSLSSSSWRFRKANSVIQSEKQGSQWCRFQFECEGLRTRYIKTRRRQNTPAEAIRQEGDNSSSLHLWVFFFFASTFCFIQAFNDLDDVHPDWGGQSTLLNPPIQMLILSRTPSQKHPL